MREGTGVMEGKVKRWLIKLNGDSGWVYETAEAWQVVQAHDREFVIVKFKKSYELFVGPSLYEIETGDDMSPVGFRRLL